MSEWHDAKLERPECDGMYLVIYETLSTAPHIKKGWAWMGKPELGYYAHERKPQWSPRGTLTVAYWMPLPKFTGRWVPGPDGVSGAWDFSADEQEPTK
jgi:hypothetical protein